MKKILALFVLMLAGCGSPSAPDSSNIGVNRSPISSAAIYCDVDRECKEADPAPYCENSAAATCGPDNLCNFRLDTSADACTCIEGAIRFCDLGTFPDTTGIQTCVVATDEYDNTTESWGECTSGYSGTVASGVVGVSYGLNNCRSIGDCQEASDFPACGSYGYAHDPMHPELWEDTDIFCEYPPGVTDHKECVIGLATEDSGDCECLERDVRTCTTSGSMPGHQTCVVTGSASNPWGHSTGWGTCT